MEISLPAETLAAITNRPDEAELWALDDPAEIRAWLDSRGLAYTVQEAEVVPDRTQPTERERAQRARARRRRR